MIPQKGDPASGSAGKGGRMGRKNQGFALMPYILQGIQHFRRHFGVQGGGGFIKKKDFRVMSESPGKGDSLSLSA
jgi:hypothetical protein